MKQNTGLSALTLFRAYEAATTKMAQIKKQRGYTYGIAVDNDSLACKYRYYARLIGRLYLKLCTKCGGRDGWMIFVNSGCDPVF